MGVVPAHGPLRQLLEVVRGSWLTLSVGEDCGHRRLPDGRPLHRGGEPAAVQGGASGHPAQNNGCFGHVHVDINNWPCALQSSCKCVLLGEWAGSLSLSLSVHFLLAPVLR